MCLVNLGGALAQTTEVFGYPFQPVNFPWRPWWAHEECTPSYACLASPPEHRHICHILPPSEIDEGMFSAVFAGWEGKSLFHRIGWKGRMWQLRSCMGLRGVTPILHCSCIMWRYAAVQCGAARHGMVLLPMVLRMKRHTTSPCIAFQHSIVQDRISQYNGQWCRDVHQ